MDTKVLIYAGGVYHLCWAVFDSFWPIILNWKKRLSALDDLNRVLPYITSRLLVVLYLMLAYISFFHTSELIEARLGKTMLFFVSIYWIVRFVMQIQFMSIKKVKQFDVKVSDFSLPSPFNKLSNQSFTIMLFVTFLIGIALYLIPAVMTTAPTHVRQYP